MKQIIWDIRALFKRESDNYQAIRVDNFWDNNYIEYESNGKKNKNLSVQEYVDEIKPYLRDIIINLQKSDEWEI